ncbi:DUF3572 family protein [Xanthobacteraceae bacterium A53D]
MGASVVPISAMRDEAERVAAATLLHISSEVERLSDFLAETGTDPAGVRRSAASPMFLRLVMAYASRRFLLIEGAARVAGVSVSKWHHAHRELSGPGEARAARRERLSMPPLAFEDIPF